MTKAERTKQFIIEQAAPIFNEKGIAGTSIDDVLKAAKVAKGCLYGHFENKEALTYASIDYLFEKLAEGRDAALQKQTTAKGKLLAFMDLNKYPLNFPIAGGCPILNISIEADDTNPTIRQKVQVMIASVVKLLTSIAQQGIQDGEFASSMKPEAYALKLFAAIEGGNMISRAMNSNEPMQPIISGLKSELNDYCLDAA